jgi:outer membrane protein OmpA-like peptidoglycan-associated protein
MSDPVFSRTGRIRCLLLVLLATLAVVACDRAPAPAPKAPVVAREQFDATLSVVDNSGRIRFDATIDTAATKTKIEQALLAAYGPNRAGGDILVDDVARPAPWLPGLAEFMNAFATVGGAAVRFEGDTVVLSGNPGIDQRRALRAAAEQAFPGLRLQGLFELPADPDAKTASLSPEALAKNLNQMPVQFKPGSGEVSDDSLALVAQAADAIRSAPAGTRLLIVGPVVATPDTGNDIFLSKQRAEALKVQLILNGISPAVIDTRGWGEPPQGTPADPATPPPTPPPGGAPMRFELVR